MRNLIKLSVLFSILIYSQSFAATIGYYNNHLAPYTNPGSANLGGIGPNLGTFCNDDGDGDGTFNRVASGNSSTSTDPESGILSSVPAAGTMRCLYYDAVAPSGIVNYDFTHLNDQQKITVTITCTDVGGSGCDTDTNDLVNSGSLGWTVLGGNQYRKVCTGIDLNTAVTVSNTTSCAGPITFRDISGRITNLVYNATNGTGNITQNLSSQLKIKGIAQGSSNTNAAGIKANDATANASIKDNFSKISKLNLKTTILKNVDKLLKSVNRSTILTTSTTINNLNNIISADKIITSGSKKLYYFKDKEVTIDEGVHNINKNITLIIERGNLKIKGNINYQNGGMLGLILIGNKNGTKSNIFVDENITNGAGILYTDGTVQSSYNNTLNDYNIYTSSNINDRGLNQLYWKGSFISQNTIGGSVGIAKCPYGTTEYISKSCNTSIAKKYDLLLFRRYSLLDGSKYYQITSTDLTPFIPTAIPFGSSSKTIYISGGRGYMKSGANLSPIVAGNGTHQDKNISSSFILDYDSRITGKSAPLGFSSN